VLWSRRFFTEIEALAGDTGAKELISLYEDAVCDIEAGGAVLRDIDTPDALAALRGSAAAPA
jgi:molybdenum cofactor cytidylyltransferase